MTSNIQVIVFDFGGVLLHWDPRRVYQRFFPNDPQAVDRFLKEVDFDGWNAHQDRGRPFSEAVAELSSRFPHYTQLIQAYPDNYIESIIGALWGTVEILKQLKQKGYSLFGLSNWSAETFPLAREKYEFFELFDDIVLSGAVGYNKPEPEIYHILLERIGRPARECMFIDDSFANIQQAQKIGFTAVQFESPEQLAQTLHDMELL
jgi:2-haloacid dehalogenase